MKPAKFASNKTKLAAALGIGRTLFYQFARLPDAPPPRANGMHNIAEWRKFIASRSANVQASEKEQLQLAGWKIRNEREQFELEARRGTFRDQIINEFMAAFDASQNVLRNELTRMPDLLAPRFAGLEPREIRRLWRQQLDEVFARIVITMRSLSGETSGRQKQNGRKVSNVIQIKTAAK